MADFERPDFHFIRRAGFDLSATESRTEHPTLHWISQQDATPHRLDLLRRPTFPNLHSLPTSDLSDGGALAAGSERHLDAGGVQRDVS